VITGGQALEDTLKGFAELAATTSDRSIVIWLNQYFGRIEHAGKTFTEMIVFEENHHKLLGSIGVPKRNQDTFGRDVEDDCAQTDIRRSDSIERFQHHDQAAAQGR